MSDARMMQAALAFARRGLGQTAPNPTVAALVVDQKRHPPVILGRGRTAPGGRPHAEALAIAAAGEGAKGATLYVTLEPCANRSSRHFGPSCSELIISHGIARVVIAADDPSPFAAGLGAQRLREAGISVITGVLAEEAHALNLGHIRRVLAHRPLVQVKLAQTADGFAGTIDHRPLAITGEASRAFVHRMRANADAILTGIGTVLADDPQLNVRLPGMERASPLRIVLDTQGRMPQGARMIAGAGAVPVILATARPDLLLTRFAGVAGVEVLAVPECAKGQLDLVALLGALAARGLTRVMVEAGPSLANAFAEAGLIDELVLLTGPETVGDGLAALGPDLQQVLAQSKPIETMQMGRDTIRIYEVQS